MLIWVAALAYAATGCSDDPAAADGDSTTDAAIDVEANDAIDAADATDADAAADSVDDLLEVPPDTEIPNEVDSLDDVGSDTDITAGICGDGVVDPGEDCDDGNLDDLDGCDRTCAVTRVVRPPEPGEVVINELMINPSLSADPKGEWLELASLASDELDLSACVLVDDGTDRVSLQIVGGIALAPGALFVAASAPAAAALKADLGYTTMLLDDAADEVVLVCDDVIVDRFVWTPFAWPVISGRALSLDPSRRDAAANDAVDAWCAATATYGGGERGTPHAANPACPHLDRAVDRCRLLGDPNVSGFADAGVAFDVEVEELGLTDLTTGVDASPELIVEVGHAAGAVDVAAPESFTWTRSQPLAGYQAAAGSRADVWRGEVVAPAGTRRVMARASRDGGASWRYCDRDGSDNGVSLGELATLAVGPSPCANVVCNTPPPAVCAPDGVHLEGFETIGSCIPLTAASFDCDYPATTSDCGLLGRVCEDGTTAICGAVPRTPEVSDLILSELMIRPSAAAGQWVEVRSEVAEPLLLTGCVLAVSDDTGTREWVLEAPTVIGPSGLVVFGRTDVFEDNGGALVDRAWGEALGEVGLPTAGTLMLTCGDLLDTVDWDPSWPGVSGEVGASASLSPLRRAPADNDAKDSWCRATNSFGGGDRGTPGSPNPSCPGDIVPIDSCLLGGTTSLTPAAGTQATVPVRVVARTWTAKTPKTDPNAKLVVEVGFARRNATANAVTTWSPGVADTSWTATGAGVDPAEDRYLASFRVPAPGAFDLYARATADGGNTWVVCDTTQIIAPDVIGAPVMLNPTASACSPDPCAIVPAPYCRPVTSGSPLEVIASSAPAACSIQGGVPLCSYVETVAEDCAELGAVCGDEANPDGARCTGFPRVPAVGELVISELVIAAGALELGEWIELQNVAEDALDLTTCGLRSRGSANVTEAWDFGASLTPLGYVVAPDEAVTVARSGNSSVNGNSQPITVYSGIALDNSADELSIVCTQSNSETVIDRVTWSTASGWVIPQLTSLQLTGAALDASSNDLAKNFCAPGVTSPHEPNRVCPGDRIVDDCRVLSVGQNVIADEPFEVSLIVKDLDVTDLRHGPDAAIGMLVEVGLGPEGDVPMTSFSWHWVELDPDDAWDDRVGPPTGFLGSDRWVGASSSDVVGPLRLLGRVSLDAGATWTLCGVSGIASGANPATSGRAITSRAGLCTPSPCTTPPAATCSGATLTGYAPRGTCTADETATCSYPSETFSCSSYGGCNAANAGCNATPPKPTAVGSLVISEVMRDSTLPAPDGGEWIEVHNAGLLPLDLRGCELVDEGGNRTTIQRGVPDVVLAGQHAIFAHSPESSQNGGIPTAFGRPRSLGELVLGNASGSIALVCQGVQIDRVSWSFGWPGQTGVAMQLDRAHINGSDNDLRANWCAATPSYGAFGNQGSPGSLNPSCP